MKRLHVHVAVSDLAESIGFYSTLFAAQPTVREADYAKWMLDDPRVNFAISQRGGAPGVQHLGIQVEDGGELAEVYARLQQAERPVLEEKATTCCYAKSDKQWIADPQGVAWETFLTFGRSTVYGDSAPLAELGKSNGEAAACCGPSTATTAKPVELEPAGAGKAACGAAAATKKPETVGGGSGCCGA